MTPFWDANPSLNHTNPQSYLGKTEVRSRSGWKVPCLPGPNCCRILIHSQDRHGADMDGQNQKYHSRCSFLIQNRQAASPEGWHIALQSVNCGYRAAFCLPGAVPCAYINPVELIHTASTAQTAPPQPIWSPFGPTSGHTVLGLSADVRIAAAISFRI